MKWISTVSEKLSISEAFQEVTEKLLLGLDGLAPQILVAFLSGYSPTEIQAFQSMMGDRFPSSLLLGCTAGGVIGDGREVEGQSALSLTGAILPDITAIPFHLNSEDLEPALADPALLEKLLKVSPQDEPAFILLPDPLTFDPQDFIRALDQTYPASVKIGGLASGGRDPGKNFLFFNEHLLTQGMVGVALTGNIQMDTIVAQGCRPIGDPLFITKCVKNVIFELDQKPATEVLENLYQQLSPQDQELFHHSLFLGLVMKDFEQVYHQGDFLIRNLLGIVEEEKALAIGATLRENQVVQFHLRDANTSTQDLASLCTQYQKNQPPGTPPEGVLLFSCMGRGVGLYGEADHDSNLFKKHFGNIPVGGFFCNGEIGPVHHKTFLHGYTSSFGIIRRKK